MQFGEVSNLPITTDDTSTQMTIRLLLHAIYNQKSLTIREEFVAAGGPGASKGGSLTTSALCSMCEAQRSDSGKCSTRAAGTLLRCFEVCVTGDTAAEKRTFGHCSGQRLVC